MTFNLYPKKDNQINHWIGSKLQTVCPTKKACKKHDKPKEHE